MTKTFPTGMVKVRVANQAQQAQRKVVEGHVPDVRPGV
jgi:hypothetical protein